jgi:hypothetical protein
MRVQYIITERLDIPFLVFALIKLQPLLPLEAMSSIAETDVQSEILPDYASETATLTNDCASETATLTNESHALEFTTTKLDRGLTGSRTNSFPRRDVSLLRIYNHREPTSLPNALRQTLARRSCSEGRAHYELHFLLTGPGVSHGESDSRDINAAQIVALQIAEAGRKKTQLPERPLRSSAILSKYAGRLTPTCSPSIRRCTMRSDQSSATRATGNGSGRTVPPISPC